MDKALGTGRIGAIFGPILGSCLIGRGWSTLIMLEFAAVPTMFATVAKPGSRTESATRWNVVGGLLRSGGGLHAALERCSWGELWVVQRVYYNMLIYNDKIR